VKDAASASSAFSQAAKIAVGALEAIQKASPLSIEQRKAQLDSLNALELEAHKSQLTIPELAAFQKLIEAGSTGGTCAK